jgi:hypothetical protein
MKRLREAMVDYMDRIMGMGYVGKGYVGMGYISMGEGLLFVPCDL